MSYLGLGPPCAGCGARLYPHVCELRLVEPLVVPECPCYGGRSLACLIHGPLSEPTMSREELPHGESDFPSARLGSESDSFTGTELE